MNIPLAGAELFHPVGKTDSQRHRHTQTNSHDEAINRFSQLCVRARKQIYAFINSDSNPRVFYERSRI